MLLAPANSHVGSAKQLRHPVQIQKEKVSQRYLKNHIHLQSKNSYISAGDAQDCREFIISVPTPQPAHMKM